MSANNNSEYRPVKDTEEGGPCDVTGQADDVSERRDTRALRPEERCLCGALQRLASPYVFGACVCLLNFFLSAASTATGSAVLTTIERRFQLKTSQLAPFLITNDIISVLMVVFVAYYGHASHRPRLVGAGSLITGLGLILCALPHFMYEAPPQFALNRAEHEHEPAANASLAGSWSPPDAGGVVFPVCHQNATGTSEPKACTEEDQASSGALLWQTSWIILGQILYGVGTSPIMPLSVTYMDDGLKRTSTSVFIACMFVAGSFGPLLGAGIGGFSLSMHAEFYRAGPGTPRPGQPDWIGAWWLAFILSGCLMILMAVPIALFPKRIPRRGGVPGTDKEPGKEEEEGEGKEGKAAEEGSEEEGDVGQMYRLEVHESGSGRCAFGRGFLKAIRRLITNATYMFLICGVCGMLLSFSGSIYFMAKYLETQFDLPASTAPMVFGMIMAPGSLLGNLIGGYVVKKKKLTKKGMARMVVMLMPIAFLLAPLYLFLGCNNRQIAGISTGYPAMNTTGSTPPELVAGCNADCACPIEYAPVCGSDGVTYATPCHAGCLATVEGVSLNGVNGTLYKDCNCVGPTSESVPYGLNGDYDHVATEGQCPRPCGMFIPFVLTAFISVLLKSVTGNPGFMLQLRTVDDDDRSVAVGFTSMLLRLLGFIPSPIIFGRVIQTACLLSQSSCGKTGNCLVYDIVHFRFAFYGLAIGLDVISFVMFLLCYLSIRDTKKPEGFEMIPDESGTTKKIDTEPSKDSDM